MEKSIEELRKENEDLEMRCAERQIFNALEAERRKLIRRNRELRFVLGEKQS